jgi:SpoVK/Ycf46/Vps4 family AAA+-type ATPase
MEINKLYNNLKEQQYFYIDSDFPRLFDTEYSDRFPCVAYYSAFTNAIPNILNLQAAYNPNICNTLKELGFFITWSNKEHIKKVTFPKQLIYRNKSKDLILVSLSFRVASPDETDEFDNYEWLIQANKNLKVPTKISVSIYYCYESADYINSLLSSIEKDTIPLVDGPRVTLVTSGVRGLSSVSQNISSMPEMDLELHYGASFVKTHEIILNKLMEERGKGLVLLHGIPGTGKTSYIRYLCKHLEKEIIFLPPYLADNISSPDFIPFLLEHTNSILIIEDAERAIVDRDSSSSNRQGVSNILNMTDGILSDVLSIQIIATFNTIREKIDKALLRKGRLIAEHKFDLLDTENSNKLLKHLGKQYETKVPMSLSEIYNLEQELPVVEEERTTIGFNNRY